MNRATSSSFFVLLTLLAGCSSSSQAAKDDSEGGVDATGEDASTPDAALPEPDADASPTADADAVSRIGNPGVGKAYGLVAAVYMQHNDVARTGANPWETVLDTTNVEKSTFGLLYSRSVVGQIYAQPLYAPAITMPDGIARDIVIVATEHDDVYAFDANDVTKDEPLWHVHLAEPVPTGELLWAGLYCSDLSPEVGITATPTIDPERNILYVETKEKLGTGAYTHRLHALNLATGAERAESPVEITAGVAGDGDGSEGGVVSFNPLREHARSAILLSRGVLWLAFAGHCDATPFHGWILAYDATTLRQLGAWVDTPNSSDGGIWMGGQGLAADENGDTFFLSGNGPYSDGYDDVPPELGDTFGKLHLSETGIEVMDWFTPYNQEILSDDDLDLGSTGIMLLPGTRWIIGAGKEGRIYVVDRDDMGKNRLTDDNQIIQNFQATQEDPAYGHPLFGSPVYWNGMIYLWGVNDYLRAYRLGPTGFDTTPVATGATGIKPLMPGGILSLSSNGKNPGSAVLWASHPKSDAGRATAAGVLRAFDAENIAHELWNSDQIPERDAVGTFAKFTPPTVVDGRVYLATFSGKLNVYGLLP